MRRKYARVVATMRPTASICLMLGAFLYVADGRADIGRNESKHSSAGAVKTANETPHCDWVGPGGRAVYRCSAVNPPRQ